MLPFDKPVWVLPANTSHCSHPPLSSSITSLKLPLRFLHNFCLFSVTAAIFICSDVISSAAEIAALSFSVG